ncbi:hypothetical protein BH20ACI1_BH20ACI1_14690 [soil metagenome]
MKSKNFFALVFLLVVFVAFGSAQIFAQTQKLTIGNLKGKDYLGCGCAFQTLAEAKKPRSQKIVFWSEFDKKAILNINGKDTTFKLVKEGKRPSKEKIGSRFSDEYAANGITVKVDYLTTRVCLKGEEECEATSYDVTITVLKGNLKTVVKTKGACGC